MHRAVTSIVVAASLLLAGAPSVGAVEDTTPPETWIVDGPADPYGWGVAQFDYDSDEGPYEGPGTPGPDDVRFECSLDDGPWEPCDTSYIAYEGPHVLLARAIDPAGNVDPTPAEWFWTTDLTDPDTTITGPAFVRTPDADFELTSDEEGSTFECRLSPSRTFTPCDASHVEAGLAEGGYRLEARAVDAAGNADESPAVHDFRVDRTAPSLSFPSVPSDPSTTAVGWFRLASSEEGSTARCRVGAGAWSPCPVDDSFSVGPLPDGDHVLEVELSDRAGNVTVGSHRWTIAAGTAGIEVLSRTPRFTRDTMFWVTWEQSGEIVSRSCRWEHPGGALTWTDEGCTSGRGLRDDGADAFGDHTFTIEVVDRRGARATDVVRWTHVDSRPWARSIDDACPAGEVEDAGFADVTPGTAADAAIDCLAWWSITNGYGEGTYRPSRPVTRGMMAAFIARVIRATGGELPTASGHFSDTAGHTFEADIDALAAAGIVGGYSGSRAGEFGPDDLVLRAHMAKFLANTYEHVVGEPLPDGGLDLFTDDERESLEPLIDRIGLAGIAKGYGDGTYGPRDTVRRDHMAYFLMRLVDLLVEDGHGTPPA